MRAQSPAFKVDDRHYTFSPLGNNAPLFNQPQAEETITHLAEPANVFLIEEIERLAGRRVNVVAALREDILATISCYDVESRDRTNAWRR